MNVLSVIQRVVDALDQIGNHDSLAPVVTIRILQHDWNLTADGTVDGPVAVIQELRKIVHCCLAFYLGEESFPSPPLPLHARLDNHPDSRTKPVQFFAFQFGVAADHQRGE